MYNLDDFANDVLKDIDKIGKDKKNDYIEESYYCRDKEIKWADINVYHNMEILSKRVETFQCNKCKLVYQLQLMEVVEDNGGRGYDNNPSAYITQSYSRFYCPRCGTPFSFAVRQAVTNHYWGYVDVETVILSMVITAKSKEEVRE